MVLAWAACIIGFAIGVLGCAWIAFGTAPPPKRRATRARPRAQAARRASTISLTRPREPVAWADDVANAARETLSVLRRLANGVAPGETSSIAGALRAGAARLAELGLTAPETARDDGTVAQLLVAARGARAEADHLEGAALVTNERRAFLDALRSLRTVDERYGAASSA